MELTILMDEIHADKNEATFKVRTLYLLLKVIIIEVDHQYSHQVAMCRIQTHDLRQRCKHFSKVITMSLRPTCLIR